MVISDDEEESRARVITKKARIDPFAPKQKEKKKAKADKPAAQPTSSPSKTATPSSKPKPVVSAAATPTPSPAKTVPPPPKEKPAEPHNKYSDIEEIPRPKDLPVSALSKSAKRRKKRKHKSTADGELIGASVGPSHTPSQLEDTSAPAPPRGPAAPTGEKREVIIIKDTPPPDAPPPSFLASAYAKARSFLSESCLAPSP